MLHRLAFAGWGPLGYRPRHKDNKLFDAGPLEEPDMAHVRCVGQYHWIRTLRAAF